MSIKKVKSILIDDEPENNEVLELMLSRVCPQVEIIAKCNSADKAVDSIQKYQPDLIFLDIEMPVKDGFQILKAFEKARFKVIIVTGHQQYALKAIKYAAIDYVLKPVAMNELILAVKKVEERLSEYDTRLEAFSEFLEEDKKKIEKILIPSTNGFKAIKLANILSITGESGNYCLFKLANRETIMAAKPLRYFEELLPASNFFRIHRSHLVNLDKVIALDRSAGNVILENKESLKIAFRRRADFFNAYKKFIS